MEVIDFGKPVKTDIKAVFDSNGNSLPEIINSAGNSLFSATYPIIYPEDFDGNTLHEKIMNAMEFVKISGGGFEVNFSKSSEYVVSSAIEIPSNTTIKIENCTIRMADNIVDNMFRSANIIPSQSSPLGHCENCEDMEWLENIRIIGNNATLIMEDNTSVYGADNVGWRGTIFCLVGINGFEISGLSIQKNLSWAINITGCCNGSIHDITFNTTRLNGDGVDITKSHDISVYNIEGITFDDAVAIGSFGSERYIVRPQEVNIPIIPTKYDYRKFGTDTYNIHVKDINARSAAHVLILITGTYQVYNVSVSNLSDKYDGSAFCNAVVKIYGGQYNGDYSYDLIHNCSIMNVKGYNCQQSAAVWLKQGLIENGRIYNVQVPSGDLALKNESGTDIANYNMQVVEGENLA